MVFGAEVEDAAGADKAFHVFNGATQFFTVSASRCLKGFSKDHDGIIAMAAEGAGRFLEFCLILIPVMDQDIFLVIVGRQVVCYQQAARREDNPLSCYTGGLNIFDVAEAMALEDRHFPAGLADVFGNNGLGGDDGSVDHGLDILGGTDFGNDGAEIGGSFVINLGSKNLDAEFRGNGL